MAAFSLSGGNYSLNIKESKGLWETVVTEIVKDQWHKLKITYNNSTSKFNIALNDIDKGEYSYNRIGIINRAELNGGGWNNLNRMDTYFDGFDVSAIQ